MYLYSLAQSFKSRQKKGQAPINEYEWKDGIFGKVGIKRVETKRFIGIERLSRAFARRKNWHWYSRRSNWFINVSFCKMESRY